MAKPAKPASRAATPGRIRCAIYTRKSTEEGLDQAFNSLDAQREACAAYVLSQRHEGWTLVPDHYDDGGFSGGNMDRPGLKQLMGDVAAGKVDVIVVYKVDRLTRALSDFARIVDVLDGAGASFVSITQAFNTTTSMGRLTLNVLLSFAQFEREVTSERIRDKVAASKRKGMWMGGSVPLGYQVSERKLIIVPAEADTVRHIYQRYLALGSLTALATELDDHDIRSKSRVDADGIERGSLIISMGALAHILKNRIYIGEITHKGEVFPGEHAAVVDRTLWEQVQVRLATNRTNKHPRASGVRSLLIGRISDAEGRAMTPVHANKQGRRYRYYVTRPESTGRRIDSEWRLPAGEIEQLVIDGLVCFLRDSNTLAGIATGALPLPAKLERAAAAATMLMASETRMAVLIELDATVSVEEHRVSISISLETLTGMPSRHSIVIPARLTRRGQELRLAYPPADHRAPVDPDVKLVGLIAKAEDAHRELLANDAIDKIRRAHLTRLARLRYLAPDVVSAILDGRHPVELSARKLLRAETIPLSWPEQRRALGFA